ncbi:MAG: DUF92 domain-containing protein [Candidatus Caldarchaeum sp.]|nr:DUF92 domain-containing protein [Candidatus Caldarchaeum sp.]
MIDLWPVFLEATAVIGVAGLVALLGRFLDVKGVVAAVAVGYVVYVLGGRPHFLLLFVFFVVAGFTTRYRYREKYGEFGKGVRTWTNVLSNGGAAALIAAAGYFLDASSSSFIMFAGAISSVFADTMSTEIGLLSKKPPISITTFKPASPGTPGGVSVLGLVAGFLTGFIVVAAVVLYDFVSGASWNVVSLTVVCVFSGFTGSLFDSVFGGLFQSRYRCIVCGRAVEVKKHCRKETEYISGNRYINNDLVNLLTSFYGAFAAYSIWVYMN